MTSCDMRPLRIVRPPPRPGGSGVLAPALGNVRLSHLLTSSCMLMQITAVLLSDVQ